MPESDQGLEQKRYQVVPRTLIFLFDRQNRVLLLKGSPEKRLWPGLLNGIGGHVESGEDIFEAACRELFEETGLNNIPLDYCAQIMIDISDAVGVALFVFRGEISDLEFQDSSEGTLIWTAIDELGALPVVEDLPYLIPRIESSRVSSDFVFGKYAYNEAGTLVVSFCE